MVAGDGSGGVSVPEVRPAEPDDVPVVFGFILELARYERLEHAVRADAADIRRALFGPRPRAFCDLALLEGTPVGFALWFYNFSTFEGRAGIYLEDLYVRPEARGRGAGLLLLKTLARRCAAEELGRLDWSVLDWNAPAISFYDALGAERLDDWTVRRLSGDALQALAEGPG